LQIDLPLSSFRPAKDVSDLRHPLSKYLGKIDQRRNQTMTLILTLASVIYMYYPVFTGSVRVAVGDIN